MKFSVLAVGGFVAAAVASVAPPAPEARVSNPFSYDSQSFYVHGKKLQIIGGQMDPQRVPRAYWSDRLEKAKAMGLNTIFSYVYWNELEPSPGQWDWEGVDGINDISAWYEAIQQAGLYAVLRPGPYVCGERDWGGFPAWLAQVPNMTVRANNPQFLNASQGYLSALGAKLQRHQITHGGPILMTQVENEYGSFGSDHAYTGALAGILRESFDVDLYTNDGGVEADIQGGHVHGALAEVDGAPVSGFAARQKYVTDPTSMGPLLDGEYYTLWFAPWSATEPFPTVSGIGRDDAQVLQDIEYILAGNNSLSLYMYHGGTNFAYGAGSTGGSPTNPVITSYDYGAPLDESGRPTSLYNSIRALVANYTAPGSIPPVPSTPAMSSVDAFQLRPASRLFDALPKPVKADAPVAMEDLGQARGFVLYEHDATASASGLVQPGDKARDRVVLYVNGAKRGVIDSIYSHPANVSVDLKRGDKLSLLVENLGRVDFSSALVEQRKGIVGNVSVGGQVLEGWASYSLPASLAPDQHAGDVHVQANSTPLWYTGSFGTQAEGAAADTFLELKNATKGVVWVNGRNLGRYWAIGPQQSLYVPGYMLKSSNDVAVLELEPQAGATMTGIGVTTRMWANYPDPDCHGCQ